MSSRERSPVELGEDLDEIKATLNDMRIDLRNGYVPRELYEARHSSLRSEISAEVARLRADVETKASRDEVAGVRSVAQAAARMSWGVFALIAGTAVTVVGAWLAGGGPT